MAGERTLSRRVIKVGGSLFGEPSSPERLRTWLAAQPPGQNILVTGGGDLVDGIRRWDRLHGLEGAAAHWLCVDLLSITARLVASWLPGARVVNQLAALPNDCAAAVVIFDPADWMRKHSRLEQSWHVTSDAISGELASQTNADELVLLKSCLPDPAADLPQLARVGFVDSALVQIGERLKQIRVVDLRAAGFPEQRIGGGRLSRRRRPVQP
jgi:hypothetical protein